jgi:hypothetical protein
MTCWNTAGWFTRTAGAPWPSRHLLTGNLGTSGYTGGISGVRLLSEGAAGLVSTGVSDARHEGPECARSLT